MTYSNNNNRPQTRTREATIGNWIKWLILSEWSLERPVETFMRAAFVMFLAGLVIAFFKGADGVYCGREVVLARPDTWSSWVGCFGRSAVRRVPDDFMEINEFEAPPEETGSDDLVEGR